MTIESEALKSEDRILPVTAMREPPGRLGAIVRRLKQSPPMPPPIVKGAWPGDGAG